MQNRHILAVTSVYPLTTDCNRGTFVREIIVRSSSSARFTVFAPADLGCQSHVLDGVPVYRFRYCLKRFENLTGDGAPTKLQKQPLYLLVAAFYIVCGAWQLFWLCQREKPDLLHIHWPFPHGLMAMPARIFLGIPLVFSFYGAELLLINKFKFVDNIFRWLLPITSKVTAISSFTAGLIHKRYDVPLTIIPYGLTIEPKAPKKQPPGTTPRLLFVGRLDERKGLRYLLAALPLVLATHPVRLRIVGKGILEAEIKSQCQTLGLDSVIDFLGFVSKEELADEYAKCDIFVLPAIVDSKGDTEGLGIVMIEALAHQKPVIASAVGGITDVIQSGITGLLVPEKNPEALAQAICKLLSEPDLAAEMGQKGCVDIQNRFSWEKIIPMWQNVFAAALAPTSSTQLVEK